jgi:predicted transcriptional regulator
VDAFHDAADSGRLGKTRQAVLDALRGCGPLTRHELADVTGLPLSSVCGRVNELIKAGEAQELVEDGRRVRRDGRHIVTAVIHNTRAA